MSYEPYESRERKKLRKIFNYNQEVRRRNMRDKELEKLQKAEDNRIEGDWKKYKKKQQND